MYGLFVLYWIQKAPETCGHSIDVRGTVPGIYESLRQRVAAWRRYGMHYMILPEKEG